MVKKRNLKTFLIVVFVSICVFIVLFYLLVRPILNQVYTEAETGIRDKYPLSQEFSSKDFKISLEYPSDFSLEELIDVKTINVYRKTSGALTPREASILYIEVSSTAFKDSASYSLRDLEQVLVGGEKAVRSRYVRKEGKEKDDAPPFFNSPHTIYMLENTYTDQGLWYGIHVDPDLNSEYTEVIEMILGSVELGG